jgi:hypothetical protein
MAGPKKLGQKSLVSIYNWAGDVRPNHTCWLEIGKENGGHYGRSLVDLVTQDEQCAAGNLRISKGEQLLCM